MTDRVKGCVVSFSVDIRVDDVEPIINAIRLIRGVAEVAVNVTNRDDWINRVHVREEIRDDLLSLYRKMC